MTHTTSNLEDAPEPRLVWCIGCGASNQYLAGYERGGEWLCSRCVEEEEEGRL